MGIEIRGFSSSRGAAAWIASFVLFAAAVSCEFDRYDKNREDIEERVRMKDTEDSSIDSGDDDTSGDQDTSALETDEDTSTETDYSCDYAPCTSDADCSCTPSAQCIREGPSMVKDHCFIVDCDPEDPATCPEGKDCIDAGPFSQGILGMVCFNL